MNQLTEQRLVANYMAAVANFLSCQPGCERLFIEKVDIIMSGVEPDASQLIRFRDSVQRTGRPLIWIHNQADVPNVPLIGLVAAVGDQVYTIENCMLWTSPNGKTTFLVPDNFKMGAFSFDEELRLVHTPTAPGRGFSTARAAMARLSSSARTGGQATGAWRLLLAARARRTPDR